jgi:hypothetical protein
MTTRIRLLLAGLAATTILAASFAATSAGAPTQVSGSGDKVPPTSYWKTSWNPIDAHGRYWKGWNDGNGDFSGGAFDNSTDALQPGKVARVMVAVDRVRGGQCQRMSAAGRLGRAGSCKSSNWLRASGTTNWSYHIRRKLPKGHYRLHRQAVDAAGNSERPHELNLMIRR